MDRLCLIFNLLCIVQGCYGQLVTNLTGAMNQAVLASDPVAEFTCTITQNIALPTYIGWEECITRTDGFCDIIFSDHVYDDPVRGERYGITSGPDDNQYNLSISPLTLSEDAGQYLCVAINDPNWAIYAELILLDGEPVCTNNATDNRAGVGDVLRYVCEVPYASRWAPIMEWSENGVPLSDVTNESSPGVSRYSTTIEVTSDQGGAVYACRTFFSPPTDTGPDEATHAPSYEHDFSFPPLQVQ